VQVCTAIALEVTQHPLASTLDDFWAMIGAMAPAIIRMLNQHCVSFFADDSHTVDAYIELKPRNA
jgi:protein tyrosine phosphatase